MSWFSSLFSDNTTKIVDSVGSTVDKIFTSDDERLKARNMLEQIKNESKKIDVDFEAEISKRWESDKDGAFTRNIRPFSYLLILALFVFVVLFDGNYGTLSIKEAYIPLIETLLVTMTIAYFGGRSTEKVTKLFKGDKKNG